MREKLNSLKGRLDHLGERFRIAEQRAEMADVEAAMGQSDFWNAPEKAQETVKRLKELKEAIEPFDTISEAVEEAEILLELAEEDPSAKTEAESKLALLEPAMARFEFKAMLTGPHDHRSAFVNIHAGAGGTESCDWASMLTRMYTRWMERSGFEPTIYEQTHGEETGIRSITLHVKGQWAYGYLRAEIGVHRLVRISPYDSQGRRHTSFASVDVVPELDDTVEIEIEEKDLRVDTYRASGPGGQHVNKTSSAIRLTHLPTGVVVACQSERSQHKNRASAMKMLKAKLFRLEEMKKEKELASLYGEKGEIAWGNQIRSYVLQPYTMVKDHRTGHETGNTHAVLDGEIDDFIEIYLKQAIGS